MRRLFHLCSPSAWDAAKAKGSLEPASLTAEGFVHLSYGDQVAGTLAVHFARGRSDVNQLLLLELAPAALGDELVVEPSRGGALFPHLYRALRPGDVVAVHTIARGDGDLWDLPPGL